jgi:hypothetical protein
VASVAVGPSYARNPVVTRGYGLAGEDVAQLAGDGIRVPVQGRFEIAPLGLGRVRGQLAL